MKIKSILKNKRADVFAGTFICIMIIMVALTLMSLTFLVNTHYKVTREMQHSLSLVTSDSLKDMAYGYASLDTFDSNTYYLLVKDNAENIFINELKNNSYFTYNEDENTFEGNGFKIRDITVTVNTPFDQQYTIPDESWEGNYKENEEYDPDSGFNVYFTVNAKIDYTANPLMADHSVTLTTGDIKFTSAYEYLDNINDYQNGGGNKNYSKYQDK